MKAGFTVFLAGARMLALAASGMAQIDHSDFITGPFKTGPDVTKKCLECHEKEGNDFIKTPHWLWKGPTRGHIRGYEKSNVEYGKTNMLNAFCVSVEGGPNQEARGHCSECHPSYVWNSKKFDFSDKTKIDCLICHAQKGDYGREDDVISDFADLKKAATSVGLPTLKNCGACHYAGGSDDGVKHGDLDSTLNRADKSLDVHMAAKAKGGQGFTCQACHTTKDHRIAGASAMTATYDGRVYCEDCHTGKNAPHMKSGNGAIINSHLKTVACQTCHIPEFARVRATMMSWDWSTATEKLKLPPQEGRATFYKGKGTFTWAKNVVPTYMWYDGTIDRYMKGDKIKDSSKPVILMRPYGAINEKKAKIYPFKYFTGRQPMDAEYKYLSIFQQYKGLWDTLNWQKSLEDGAKGSGLPYSGKYRFVSTGSYIAQNHMIAPKENALTCGDCHMGGSRMNWKALGYKGDPMLIGGGRLKKSSVSRGLNHVDLNYVQENWVAKHQQKKVRRTSGHGESANSAALKKRN
jgi:octaheme c-type cytochrome (tetrathionate reductase family)